MRFSAPLFGPVRAGGLALMLAAALGAAACSSPGRPADGSTKPVTVQPEDSAGPGSAPARDGRGRARPLQVRIAAVGDTMLGDTPDLPSDPERYFDAVRRKLNRDAQVVFGNLEGTLTTVTTSKCRPVKAARREARRDCFAFRAPPRYVRYLRHAGFTILNNANNHCFDFGAAGQAQTVRTIRAAGLAQTGLPGEITVVRAGRVRVAFVAFAPYDYAASLLDVPAARALIKRAARQARVVVVYVHAGAEGSAAVHVTGHEEYYLGEDRGNPEAFAHMAIRAGASLVIASGPHVLRGLQFYRHRLIAYSLGNFAGYNNFSASGDMDMSMILRVTLSAAGAFKHARIYPVQLTGPGRPVPGGSAVSFVARLSVSDFGASAARVLPSGVIKAP